MARIYLDKNKNFYLTPQEYKCVKLWARHYSAKQTGAILNLSERTVLEYLGNVRKRFRYRCPSEFHEILIKSNISLN